MGMQVGDLKEGVQELQEELKQSSDEVRTLTEARDKLEKELEAAKQATRDVRIEAEEEIRKAKIEARRRPSRDLKAELSDVQKLAAAIEDSKDDGAPDGENEDMKDEDSSSTSSPKKGKAKKKAKAKK